MISEPEHVIDELDPSPNNTYLLLDVMGSIFPAGSMSFTADFYEFDNQMLPPWQYLDAAAYHFLYYGTTDTRAVDRYIDANSDAPIRFRTSYAPRGIVAAVNALLEYWTRQVRLCVRPLDIHNIGEHLALSNSFETLGLRVGIFAERGHVAAIVYRTAAPDESSHDYTHFVRRLAERLGAPAYRVGYPMPRPLGELPPQTTRARLNRLIHALNGNIPKGCSCNGTVHDNNNNNCKYVAQPPTCRTSVKTGRPHPYEPNAACCAKHQQQPAAPTTQNAPKKQSKSARKQQLNNFVAAATNNYIASSADAQPPSPPSGKPKAAEKTKKEPLLRPAGATPIHWPWIPIEVSDFTADYKVWFTGATYRDVKYTNIIQHIYNTMYTLKRLIQFYLLINNIGAILHGVNNLYTHTTIDGCSNVDIQVTETFPFWGQNFSITTTSMHVKCIETNVFESCPWARNKYGPYIDYYLGRDYFPCVDLSAHTYTPTVPDDTYIGVHDLNGYYNLLTKYISIYPGITYDTSNNSYHVYQDYKWVIIKVLYLIFIVVFALVSICHPIFARTTLHWTPMPPPAVVPQFEFLYQELVDSMKNIVATRQNLPGVATILSSRYHEMIIDKIPLYYDQTDPVDQVAISNQIAIAIQCKPAWVSALLHNLSMPTKDRLATMHALMLADQMLKQAGATSQQSFCRAHASCMRCAQSKLAHIKPGIYVDGIAANTLPTALDNYRSYCIIKSMPGNHPGIRRKMVNFYINTISAEALRQGFHEFQYNDNCEHNAVAAFLFRVHTHPERIGTDWIHHQFPKSKDYAMQMVREVYDDLADEFYYSTHAETLTVAQVLQTMRARDSNVNSLLHEMGYDSVCSNVRLYEHVAAQWESDFPGITTTQDYFPHPDTFQKWCRIKGFPKAEFLRDRPPRPIMPRAPMANIHVARFVKPLESFFYKSLTTTKRLRKYWKCGSDKFKNIAIGKCLNKTKRGILHHNKCNEFKRKHGVYPWVLELDLSGMDTHCTEELISSEWRFFGRCYRDSIAANWIRNISRFFIINVGYFLGIKFLIRGCRMSGDMHTGLGNCLAMIAMCWAFIKKHGLNRTDILVDGDDTNLYVHPDDVDIFTTHLPSFIFDCGHELKLIVKADCWDIEWCQAKLVRVEVDPDIAKNRVFSDDFCTDNVIPMFVQNPLKMFTTLGSDIHMNTVQSGTDYVVSNLYAFGKMYSCIPGFQFLTNIRGSGSLKTRGVGARLAWSLSTCGVEGAHQRCAFTELDISTRWNIPLPVLQSLDSEAQSLTRDVIAESIAACLGENIRTC